MRRTQTIELTIAAAAAALAGMAYAAETITYVYDAKGRLVSVKLSGAVNNNVVANYTFDAADNRKTVTVTGAP